MSRSWREHYAERLESIGSENEHLAPAMKEAAAQLRADDEWFQTNEYRLAVNKIGGYSISMADGMVTVVKAHD